MTINWFGHSCFRIESKEGSILIDPFSKEIGLKPPKIKDDIVLVSHGHDDHNNVDEINPEAFLINTPGEYEKKGIAIRGISSYHDKTEGKERGLNIIYVIKAEEMTICHLGDLGQEKLTESQVDDIGDVDILLVPVGGNYTINYKEAIGVISQIEPKIIIPMHYKLKDLRVEIEGPEKFVKELGLTPEKVDSSTSLGAGKYKISKKLLPAEEMKLIMFQT
ncbi:MAG: hypothetical protein A2915_04300 [Candidatus Yanofskybacteria bacterium RIFCSPLOWO2_01_FULL_41_34]|uniref:Lactamase n=1 Tax=Candidatus Yanofskybacteria bacterium RIFCSPHIGHO2_01_FULL_41_26 TaxID=1802661 RepID=A0A1F8EEA2_9BACT|nr:MAG: hypothetical protein A2649_03400 [Candidatus Yanofskybacteria bacterium RIFCSPHIGHO2_01_FULL_41_26]OGN21625.1 MAG: hypothetical protein A2915_04300 [Candidatus Yanofskybacteria bacterium RIFCSPLOWO2_01_FULL_41_34]